MILIYLVSTYFRSSNEAIPYLGVSTICNRLLLRNGSKETSQVYLDLDEHVLTWILCCFQVMHACKSFLF